LGGRSTTTPDVQRLAAIYREHVQRVRWVLRARGIATDELDDLVHDVFLTIHRRLPARDDGIELASWVCGVARSVAFAHRRGDARRRVAVAAVPEPDARPLPDEELARREAWQRLAAALDGLHDDQREAFVLVDVMGMRAAEVAALVDAPVNTVYSRLRLARRHCEDALALPDAIDRAAWLRAAALGDEPGDDTRQRTWLAIAAALPATASTASAGIASWALAGVLTVSAVSGVAVLATPPTHADPGVRTRNAASGPPDPVVAAPIAVLNPSAPGRAVDSDPIAPRGAVRAVPRAAPVAKVVRAREPPIDALAEAIEILRAGKAELADGHGAAALRAVDSYRARFGDGPQARDLLRDVLRLERSAACAVHDEPRATSARSALVELALALADDPACP
jgi:RNA polymerase sigma-70 factor, ECF subfamily